MCVKKRTNIVLASKKNKVLLELNRNAKIQFFCYNMDDWVKKILWNCPIFHFIH